MSGDFRCISKRVWDKSSGSGVLCWSFSATGGGRSNYIARLIVNCTARAGVCFCGYGNLSSTVTVQVNSGRLAYGRVEISFERELYVCHIVLLSQDDTVGFSAPAAS